ncbi:Phosphoribosylglycinamide formyltransferase-chloroplastic [Striga hermonthica]|uniref:Phosphoribosylglycinamide formyltransferase-chloroplastic n=1 Tax=Striga hermonthica TaxID=68872 RepID=A0A9N7RKR6_STRHE|nr:Phosphoribosylglycinamide formyltransferase-chloroplastic [Striga hermonthica]
MATKAIPRASLDFPTFSIKASVTNSMPNASNIRSPKWVSLKINCSFSSRPLRAQIKSKCSNGSQVIECKGVFIKEESDAKPSEELRRKKMAVFVSRGGSNFRSIHRAQLDGSVHGDVVVLVTNKPGTIGDDFPLTHPFPACMKSGLEMLLFMSPK